MKQIIIEVLPTGEIKMETVGFQGNACEAATQAMEAALGLVAKKTKKPEYYAKRVGSQSQGGAK